MLQIVIVTLVTSIIAISCLFHKIIFLVPNHCNQYTLRYGVLPRSPLTVTPTMSYLWISLLSTFGYIPLIVVQTSGRKILPLESGQSVASSALASQPSSASHSASSASQSPSSASLSSASTTSQTLGYVPTITTPP